MIIGTDVSLDVCKYEGYMQMQYDARKKINPNTEYRFFSYWPEYCEESGIEIDILLNTYDLLEIYLDRKEGVDSFIGTNYDELVESPENADFITLLSLAQDLKMYCGL